MTMPHGGPQDLAGLADDRPLTYNDAETVYQTSLTAARDRYAELSDRDLNARTAALLRERGQFDPANLGHQLVAASRPLSAAEHLEHIAIGEVLARYYRHPSMLDHAVKAGASWYQIGAARGTSTDQARRDYREWVEGQHNLLTWTEGRIGMNDAEYRHGLGLASARVPPLIPIGSRGRSAGSCQQVVPVPCLAFCWGRSWWQTVMYAQTFNRRGLVRRAVYPSW
jgi:hypothetical protein